MSTQKDLKNLREKVLDIEETLSLQVAAISLNHYAKKNVGDPLEGFEATLWDFMKLVESEAKKLREACQ